MDTKIDTIEQPDGKFVIEMRLRMAPGDYKSFQTVMDMAACAMVCAQPKPEHPQETAPAGTQSVLEDEIAGLRTELAEASHLYEGAIEEIASLTFEKQRLQAQLIGLAR